MKVLCPCPSLFLTDNKPAGEGLICYNLLKFLSRDNNIDFDIFTPSNDINNPLEKVNIIKNFNLKFFPAPEEFYYKLKWLYFSLLTNFRSKFLSDKYDICHHMLPMNFEGSYASILKKPLIIGPIFYPWNQLQEDEYGERKIPKRIKRRLIRYFNKYAKKKFYRTLDFADSIIITVEKIKELLPEKYHKKCIKIPVGVDCQNFKPNGNKTIKTNSKTILFLAYLVKRKGLEYLIKSMPIVKNKIKDVKLKVVGDGPDRRYFENLANSLKITDSVKFIGHVNHTDTAKYFNRSDVYCLPSLGEPFGLSIAEAMASGLPVIVTDAGGAPEVVGEHNSDCIFSMRDEKSIADKIIYIFSNPDLMKKKGMQNLEYARKKYDWRIICNQIAELYENVLNKYNNENK